MNFQGKFQGWIVTFIVLALGGVVGCGDDNPTLPVNPPTSNSGSTPPPGGPEMMEVVGSAAFGNQCPYGSYVPPSPVPLELWSCPLHLNQLELASPLPSLILQADCKKKTLDVRSEDHSVPATTWEVMPDGNFYFAINAGKAAIKNDGAGHMNCTSPMVASMWGRIDCKDRDQATIHVETVWWLGKTFEDTGVGSPVPTASSSPSPTPTPTPSATSAPTPSGRPAGPTHVEAIHDADEPATGTADVADPSPACQVPIGCYFHNISVIDQCS